MLYRSQIDRSLLLQGSWADALPADAHTVPALRAHTSHETNEHEVLRQSRNPCPGACCQEHSGSCGFQVLMVCQRHAHRPRR